MCCDPHQPAPQTATPSFAPRMAISLAVARRPYRGFGSPPTRPFGSPPSRPFGSPPTRPFGSPPTRPFGSPPTRPFGSPPTRPFGSPPTRPFGSPPTRPFGSPPTRPLGSPPTRPFGSPPTRPFGSPPTRLAAVSRACPTADSLWSRSAASVSALRYDVVPASWRTTAVSTRISASDCATSDWTGL